MPGATRKPDDVYAFVRKEVRSQSRRPPPRSAARKRLQRAMPSTVFCRTWRSGPLGLSFSDAS